MPPTGTKNMNIESFYLSVQELCAKLLEVVGVAPLEIQREIITALPEILDDAQHTDAATELK